MNNQPFLGLSDWPEGEKAARACSFFKADVEEEWIAQETVSCYNCRYRRFVENGIICMNNNVKH